MHWKKCKLALFGLAWLVVPITSFAQQPTKTDESSRADWRETNAYTLGVL
jgi:hypothetical protein